MRMILLAVPCLTIMPSPAAAQAPPPASPAAARQVVARYLAALAGRDYRIAYRQWSDGGRASGMSEAGFARAYGRYARFRGSAGEPGEAEGAAGSSYITVPVEVAAGLRGGAPLHLVGKITLRRVNDVPGSTAEQRRWHISDSALRRR